MHFLDLVVRGVQVEWKHRLAHLHDTHTHIPSQFSDIPIIICVFAHARARDEDVVIS